MKFKQIFAAFMIAAFALSIQSCKKDKDDEPATLVNKWKQTAQTITAAGVTTDVFDLYFEPCEQDNIIEFKSNNTYEETEGATKCDPDDDQVVDSGSYTSTSTTITVDGETFNYTLSGNTLTLSYTEVDGGITYITKATYAKQ